MTMESNSAINNITMESNSTITYTNDMATNLTSVRYMGRSIKFDVMTILSTTISILGIIANLTVVIAFLNHHKLRRKIPNMFIINQVRGNLPSYQI